MMRDADFTNHRYRTRISKRQFRRILRLFALDLKAVQIAAITRLSRVSINRHLTALRRRMARLCEQFAPMSGEIEVDESYFGARSAKASMGATRRTSTASRASGATPRAACQSSAA